MRLLKIGRDASCDIVLYSAKASALHAELTILNNGDILLEDKNSKNGTFVMNKPIRPGSSVSLRRGDAVRFADVELQWSQVPMPEDNSQYKALYGIGSNYRNEIQLTGNTVSRYHATLKIGKNGKAYIQDHSKNGTTVNGQSVGNGQTRQIRRGDVVKCGGVQVDLKRYIPASIMPKILIAACSAIFIVLAVLVGKKVINDGSGISWGGGSPSDYISATTYIHGYYHYEVRLTDDPFIKALQDYGINLEYPKSYSYGMNKSGKWGIITGDNKYAPMNYSGTAFFVSNDGKMITNRHVACPWLFIDSDDRDAISQDIAKTREDLLPISQLRTNVDLSLLNESAQEYNILPLVLKYLYEKGVGLNTLNAWITRYKNSPIEITGRHDYIAVGYADHKYNSESELDRCTVIAESKSDDIDLAVLQLNNNQTPATVKKIINLDNAIVDSKKIRPQDETYYYIGYPLGLALNLDNLNGGLQPLMNEVKISKVAGRYELNLQGEVFGGASGSPIITKDGRLIGVVNQSIRFTTMSKGVLAKYAKDLLDSTN
ncbi:MAG: FHA domain-containing protein [Bacteroidales bacterium]|nr:FHA domain-containing protein [Bacteroidales bacterium]